MSSNAAGTKHTCFSCQCKFYDLNRPTAVCPRCGVDQKNAPKVKATPSRARAERVREEAYREPPEPEPEALVDDGEPAVEGAVDEVEDDDTEKDDD